MLTVPTTTRIYLASTPVNLQKSIDGLVAATRSVLEADPLSGHLFVFHNRRRDGLKILYWDTGGFCVLYKRLSKGRFHVPSPRPGANSVAISPAELASLLEGVDLQHAIRLKRWNPPRMRLVSNDNEARPS